MPDLASATVRCWRDFAKLPESVSNDEIFTVVDDKHLYFSSGRTDEEKQLRGGLSPSGVRVTRVMPRD